MSDDTMASLFSGGKLFDIGAMAAGLTPIWGVEYNAKIAAVAERNVPAPCLVARVEQVDYSTLTTPWLLHMSPVCKNASQAKTDAGEQPEDIDMAAGCIRAIEALRPRCITLENVWGYRTFQAFKNILAALAEQGYAVDYWHLNAADYGVPQTRKRLILMASLDFQPVKPAPTHRKWIAPSADQMPLFELAPALPPWIGWYAAIADIIHTLPETQPAPWQLDRMPEELRDAAMVTGQHKNQEWGKGYRVAAEPAATLSASHKMPRAYIVGGGNTQRDRVSSKASLAADPMFTVGATDGDQRVRALLIESENQGSEWGKGYREGAGSAPSLTARATYPRALLVDGDNASRETGESWARRSDQPAMTMRGGRAAAHRAFLLSSVDATIRDQEEPATTLVGIGDGHSMPPRAFLVTDQSGQAGEGLQILEPLDPCTTLRGSNAGHAPKGFVRGRWVKMTIQALGRFQSVPDSYQGLTSEINGNGVACLLAQRIAESIKEQDQRRKSRAAETLQGGTRG